MGKIVFMVLLGIEIIFFIFQTVNKGWNRKEKTITRAVTVALAGILLLIGVLEGVGRYLPVMLLLVIQILINLLLLVKHKEKKYSVGKEIALLLGNVALYFVFLLPALIFPQSKPIPVTGDHEVAETEFTWEDKDRKETFTNDGENRKVTVKFWYPKEEGRYPLVVFSHGAFGVIDSNYSTCKNLASNGYVVASIAHTYHAMYVEDTSGKVTMASQEFLKEITNMNEDNDSVESERHVYENSKKWMELRSGDENFVLDTIIKNTTSEDAQLWNEIDTEKIGLFGHSMGGASSVELGRERDDIDAVIDLEGTMFGEYTGFDDSTGMETYREDPYPIPVLDVNSRDIYEQAKGVPGEGYVNFYLGERADNYQSVVFEDAEHLNFTDLAVVSPFLASRLGTGDVDARTCIENVNDMVLQFFNKYLKDDDTAEIKDVY